MLERKGAVIMATTNITMRIDENLKAQLQELVSNLGMDMTTFFTISAKQAVREQRIPFTVSMNIPNEETKEAIEEVRQMKRNSSYGKAYTDVDEMMRDLLE
jgi:DNA-damage-inducible protein J